MELDFLKVKSDRIRSSECNLEHEKLQLDKRKKKYHTKVVKHWNKLLIEAVESAFLEIVKTQLNTVLS